VLVWHETHIDDRGATGIRRGNKNDVLSNMLVKTDVSLSASEGAADGAGVRDIYGLDGCSNVCRDGGTSSSIAGKREDEVVTTSRGRDTELLLGNSLVSSVGLGGLLLGLVLVLVLLILLVFASTVVSTAVSVTFIFVLFSLL